MFFRLPGPVKRTNSSVWNRAAVCGLTLCLAVATGCGHSSNPSNNSSTNSGGLQIAASLPSATVGASYNANITASGGTPPYKYAVISGQLPSGVSLNSGNGSVSGTPITSGSYGFSVSVSDHNGASQQRSLNISVANSSSSSSGSSGGSGSSGSGSGSGSGGSGSGGGGTSNSSTTNPGTSFGNLQKAGGWGQYGQGPPSFLDCSPSPCDGISFSMTQNVSSPSLSGAATTFNVGGTTPYSDALWNNHIIGPLSSQGTFDNNQTLVPTIYNFTYDVDFYGDNFGASQAIEFDINQFFSDMGFIYGNECRLAGGNEWDVWDNANAKWVPTGVPCYPNQNAWNHLTLKVQRTSDNHLTYQSITLNGNTATLNWTFEHGSAPGWYGVTVNYQMDGDDRQDSYNVSLDNLTLTYY